MSERPPRIGLIHAVMVAMDPIEQAFLEHWPETERLNLLDDRLSPDRAKDADLTAEMTERIGALADYAHMAEADGILFTCSAFGPAIERAAARLPVPVLKPNEAMFDRALEQGDRIGMVATFQPSIATMEAEFAEACERAGRSRASLRTVLASGAIEALKAGDAETHNRAVAESASGLADCDAIMLAHFSTSRARQAVQEQLSVPVLTAPDAAVLALKARLSRS